MSVQEKIQRVLGRFLNRDPAAVLSQRVLEADAAEDAFDDDDYEVDTPKRRHRGKGRVSEWASRHRPAPRDCDCWVLGGGGTGPVRGRGHGYTWERYSPG